MDITEEGWVGSITVIACFARREETASDDDIARRWRNISVWASRPQAVRGMEEPANVGVTISLSGAAACSGILAASLGTAQNHER